MRARDTRLLIGILIVVLIAAWTAWPANPGLHVHALGLNIDRDIAMRLGLDLQGGTQVLLEANVAEGETVTREAMDAARGIIENRANALGVTEPNVQLMGERRILVELPGIEDPDQAVATFGNPGRLEFIDAGSTYLEPGTTVRSTESERLTNSEAGTTPTAESAATGTPTATVAPTSTITPTATATSTAAITATEAAPASTAAPTALPTEQATPTEPAERIYTTVITGKDLKSAAVGTDEYGSPEINFELNAEGATKFGEYTSANVGKYLAITMDGVVISCPRVESAITEGRGRITGKFTIAEARSIVVQLRYGALPVPLKVVERRTVGPTLGQDSVARSLQAGVIGLVVVLLFMVVYYRLPGVMAALALLIYATVTMALFKLIPVTLTLPGIVGFLLSVGMAVDANILIFERMKEELRQGRSLGAAIDAGFDRAWTSIRDSNLSTLITCAILFMFGSSYGASAVKGFAVTLFLGVVVSMFTAITVTRTFMRATFAVSGEALRERRWLLGA